MTGIGSSRTTTARSGRKKGTGEEVTACKRYRLMRVATAGALAAFLGIACDTLPTVPTELTIPPSPPIQYESTEGCVEIEWGEARCMAGRPDGGCSSPPDYCNQYGRGSPYTHLWRMTNSCTQRESGIKVRLYLNYRGATKADADRWASEGNLEHKHLYGFGPSDYWDGEWRFLPCPGGDPYITMCTADSQNDLACESGWP